MDEMPAPVLDAGRRRQGRLAVGDRPRRSRMERVKGGSGNGDGATRVTNDGRLQVTHVSTLRVRKGCSHSATHCHGFVDRRPRLR